MENGSIDLPASRMRSGRSTNELIPRSFDVSKSTFLNYISDFALPMRRPVWQGVGKALAEVSVII